MSGYQLQISPTAGNAKGSSMPPELLLPLRSNSYSNLPVFDGGYIRNDYFYEMRILCTERAAEKLKLDDWKVVLNGKLKGEWTFSSWNKKGFVTVSVGGIRPFFELLGYVLCELRRKCPDGTTETLRCPPVKLFVQENDARQIEDIARYVIENGEEYLLRDDYVHKTIGKKEEGSKNGRRIVAFVRNIVRTYEFGMEYFRANCRAKIKLEGRVDTIEKLKSFTAETFQFIATHPEELMPTNQLTGIKSRGFSYIPRRSWIQGDRQDRNIYENQIVLGFLKTVINHISGLLKDDSIDDPEAIDETEEKKLVEQGLVDSSKIIRLELQSVHKDLEELNSKLKRLFSQYTEFMRADPLMVNSVPSSTPVFLSIPAYKQVYELLYEWFSLWKVELVKSSFFLGPAQTSRIYEYYCLIRLIKEITQEDFEPQNHFQEEIKWDPDAVDTEANINNVYRFERKKEHLTIYYGPRITTQNLNGKKSQLLLYRNSDGGLKLRGNVLEVGIVENEKWRFYEPDYVIKYETNKTSAKYLMADAKFSTIRTIQERELIELIFKYLISVSVIRKNDSINGLSVFCGKLPFGEKPVMFNVPNPDTQLSCDTNNIHICNVRPNIETRLIPSSFLLPKESTS